MRLRFIYRRRGPSLLVAEGLLNSKSRAVASKSRTGRGVATEPTFLLLPQIKLRKRLDLARDAERAVDGVQGLIALSMANRFLQNIAACAALKWGALRWGNNAVF